MRILRWSDMDDRCRHGSLSRLVRAAAVLSLAAYAFSAAIAASPVPARDAGPTTVIVFADRPLQTHQWASLMASLRRGVAGGQAETHRLDRAAIFMRGDDVVPGMVVKSALVVYLHGDCTLAPAAQRTAYGVPLGWVRRVQGRIEPFIHVDCTHIGDVLGPQAMRMNNEQRTEAMSEAIARVILHEWIHIVSQSPAHTQSGIEKAQYGVADLMGGR